MSPVSSYAESSGGHSGSHAGHHYSNGNNMHNYTMAHTHPHSNMGGYQISNRPPTAAELPEFPERVEGAKLSACEG